MLINLCNALTAGKRLPYDAEVEYLESTGTQWITIPITLESTDTIGATFTPRASSSNGAIYCSSFGNRGNLLRRDKSGNLSVFSNGGSNAVSSYVAGTEYTVVWGNRQVSVNGTPTTVPYNVYLVVSPETSISLFATATGTHSGYCAISHFYVEGKLDLIPVRKGTIGYLYDRVSGKLFGNAGTGDFQYGHDVVPVEWLQSDGNSYAVLPNNLFSKQVGYGVEVTLSKGTATFSAISILFIAGSGIYESPYYVRFSADGVTQLACPDSAWNNLYSDAGVHTIKMITQPVTGSTKVSASVDNGQSTRYTVTSSQVFADTVGVFASNNGKYKCPAGVQVYSIRGFDASNNTLAQYIPVRVGTDATSWEGAMMDVLARRIYRNAGTGAFGYGNDLKYPIPAE